MYGKWSLNLLTFLALALTLIACDWKSDQGADRLLARVFNRELHLSDLENMFPEEASRADSFLIIQAFVSRWVREELLMYEAEVGSSRVDLQACKLEYSIVSPK